MIRMTDSLTSASTSSTNTSPYKVLVELTESISELCKSYSETHKEFISTERNLAKTGSRIASFVQDVKVGMELEKLEMEEKSENLIVIEDEDEGPIVID